MVMPELVIILMQMVITDDHGHEHANEYEDEHVSNEVTEGVSTMGFPLEMGMAFLVIQKVVA
jgi:hypothetical protein